MDPLPTRWGSGKEGGGVGFVREKLRHWQATFGLCKGVATGERELGAIYLSCLYIHLRETGKAQHRSGFIRREGSIYLARESPLRYMLT